MMRYALIDNYSGFVWWVGEAADPVAACRAADDEIGPRPEPMTYQDQSGSSFANESGYYVYEVPAGFDVDDGLDPRQIETVSEFPCVAYVRVNREDET